MGLTPCLNCSPIGFGEPPRPQKKTHTTNYACPALFSLNKPGRHQNPQNPAPAFALEQPTRDRRRGDHRLGVRAVCQSKASMRPNSRSNGLGDSRSLHGTEGPGGGVARVHQEKPKMCAGYHACFLVLFLCGGVGVIEAKGNSRFMCLLES